MPQENLFKQNPIFGTNMKTFTNYRLQKGNGYAVLNADYYLCLSEENDEFILGTPRCWDDTLLTCINCDEYNIYHIFTYTVKKENVNRITDHKGVWGLNGLPMGAYSTYYDTLDKRTYIGVAIGSGQEDFKNNHASLEILLPKAQSIKCFELVDLLCAQSHHSPPAYDLDILLKVQRNLSDSIILLYSFYQDAQLVVIGEKAEMLFDEDICMEWETGNTVPCQHYP